MRSGSGVAAVILIVLISAPLAQHGVLFAVEEQSEHFNRSTLCEALLNAEAGTKHAVEIEGRWAKNMELSLLYDASEPTCTFDIQPVTQLEFAEPEMLSDLGVASPFESTDMPVLVRGVLFGPPALGADDGSGTAGGNLINRAANRRYGHHGTFRTRLLATEVTRLADGESGHPSAAVVYRPVVRQPTFHVVHGDIPLYPNFARKYGLEGAVVLRVEVANGDVKSVEWVSGDRFLAEESARVVRTWKFEDETTGAFLSLFEYVLERRLLGDHRETFVELRLPTFVRLRAAADEW